MCDSCKMSGGAKGTGQNGGAYLAPLSYLNPSYREPSSSAGPHALYSQPGLARPSINATGGSRSRRSARARAHSRKMNSKSRHKHRRRSTRKGGFFPPIGAIGSFMKSAPSLAPAVGVTAYRMVRNYKGRNKTRRN